MSDNFKQIPWDQIDENQIFKTIADGNMILATNPTLSLLTHVPPSTTPMNITIIIMPLVSSNSANSSQTIQESANSISTVLSEPLMVKKTDEYVVHKNIFQKKTFTSTSTELDCLSKEKTQAEKIFPCPKCGKIFDRQWNLDRHTQKRINCKPKNDTPSYHVPSPLVLANLMHDLSCSTCGCTFNRQFNLDVHFLENGIKCNADINFSSKMIVDTKINDSKYDVLSNKILGKFDGMLPEKIFSCLKCGKIFNKQFNLERHILTRKNMCSSEISTAKPPKIMKNEFDLFVKDLLENVQISIPGTLVKRFKFEEKNILNHIIECPFTYFVMENLRKNKPFSADNLVHLPKLTIFPTFSGKKQIQSLVKDDWRTYCKNKIVFDLNSELGYCELIAPIITASLSMFKRQICIREQTIKMIRSDQTIQTKGYLDYVLCVKDLSLFIIEGKQQLTFNAKAIYQIAYQMGTVWLQGECNLPMYGVVSTGIEFQFVKLDNKDKCPTLYLLGETMKIVNYDSFCIVIETILNCLLSS
jgi:uncharacterized C2H2 Zn-finger protein